MELRSAVLGYPSENHWKNRTWKRAKIWTLLKKKCLNLEY